MTRIEWNLPGQRRFEAGVDRVVLYPPTGLPVAWNGVTNVSEDTSGGEMSELYFDGVKRADFVASEDFTATLTAFFAPDAFEECQGIKSLAPGLLITQQPRKTFGLCYRTLLGNDLQSTDFGYKLHILYNLTAEPAGAGHQTLSDNPDPGTNSWKLYAVPPPSSTFKPTAHIVVDSTRVDPYIMEELETLLYGRSPEEDLAGLVPQLPTVDRIVTVLSNRIKEPIEATI